eukprot:2972130-Pleurochrysis_carterae.AAC.2
MDCAYGVMYLSLTYWTEALSCVRSLLTKQCADACTLSLDLVPRCPDDILAVAAGPRALEREVSITRRKMCRSSQTLKRHVELSPVGTAVLEDLLHRVPGQDAIAVLNGRNGAVARQLLPPLLALAGAKTSNLASASSHTTGIGTVKAHLHPNSHSSAVAESQARHVVELL